MILKAGCREKDEVVMKRFLESEIDVKRPAVDCRFHVIPFPFEKTVSYGRGTAAAPAAIIEASIQLEANDWGAHPAARGIYTHSACSSPDLFRACFDTVLEQGSLPVTLGGEHTISFYALKALKERGEAVGVVQFDAHADLRDSYEGVRMSHACVMRRIHELGVPLYQIGVRSLSQEDLEYRDRHTDIHYVDWHPAAVAAGDCAIALPDSFPQHLYITFDVDALDTSIMPATGTPEPGGLTWQQAQQALKAVATHRTIIGMDMVEFSPIPSFHAYDYTAARLVYSMMSLT